MLSYASDVYKSKVVIDFATLTGACVAAVGEKYTGIFGFEENLLSKLKKAGEVTNDLVWQLPLDKECLAAVKSDLADLTNTSKLKGILGASTAAAFLSNFVKDDKQWIHCDIAGSGIKSQMRKEYDLKSGV